MVYSKKQPLRKRVAAAAAAKTQGQENTAVNSQQRKRSKTEKLQTLKVACVPIVFETLKRFIDEHSGGDADKIKIVNEESFAAECTRILDSSKKRAEMIHTVALSMDFTLGSRQGKSKKEWHYKHANGLSFNKDSLTASLKSRLEIMAAQPGGKSLMLMLVIAVP
jgi:hypothetical protein